MRNTRAGQHGVNAGRLFLLGKILDTVSQYFIALNGMNYTFHFCIDRRLKYLSCRIAHMFEGREFPKSLDETVFNSWLEKGRDSKIGYNYLLVIWDEYESSYQPVFVERREDIKEYTEDTAIPRERLVAAYDLYSESRIL